ncbi:probable RNA polymerase II nuclear localization protein SLC7A6OS [Polyodon spathula]|uniref:probable RNA polymerase II nuclear localization protein SLC7A6OS n=1 Tax=Polyodon spathula TaxID=7913 RepID=UPI001B7E847E|nr:probable RNA polymerase II nuclear localization protein SLC7A6OS [Polyodon spathula]
MAATVLRVKRKRGLDPADALLLACKRLRPEQGSEKAEEPAAQTGDPQIHSSVFKLAATVSSQDAPVQKHVREALSRDRAIQALRPSSGSSKRILGELRAAKRESRQEGRYRVLSSHRAGIAREMPASPGEEGSSADAQPQGDGAQGSTLALDRGEFQVFDIVQEEEETDTANPVPSDPETILCNSVKLIREKLTVSDYGAGAEHRENESQYVYDIYYQETATPGWIQDILSVRPCCQENELVPEEDPQGQEVYEDEDDENDEGNWRNEYPEEEDDDDEERGHSDRSEGDSDEYEGVQRYGRRSWDQYQQDVLREFDYQGEMGNFDSD